MTSREVPWGVPPRNTELPATQTKPNQTQPNPAQPRQPKPTQTQLSPTPADSAQPQAKPSECVVCMSIRGRIGTGSSSRLDEPTQRSQVNLERLPSVFPVCPLQLPSSLFGRGKHWPRSEYTYLIARCLLHSSVSSEAQFVWDSFLSPIDSSASVVWLPHVRHVVPRRRYPRTRSNGSCHASTRTAAILQILPEHLRLPQSWSRTLGLGANHVGALDKLLVSCS